MLCAEIDAGNGSLTLRAENLPNAVANLEGYL